MTIDLYLEDHEIKRLNQGGVIALSYPNGIRIIIKKDIDEAPDGNKPRE